MSSKLNKSLCLYSPWFRPSVGGIETVTHLLAGHAAAAGWNVTVVTPTPGADERAGYGIVRRPSFARLRSLVAAHAVLHVNGMSARAVLAARCEGTPVVVTHQDYTAALPQNPLDWARAVRVQGVRWPLRALANTFATRFAHVNVCISSYLLERIHPPRAMMLPNPIGPNFFPSDCDARSNEFAFIGRLASMKGCDVLVRALGLAAARGQKFGLAIYGDGPERKRVEQMAQDSGAARAIRFAGIIHGEELAEAYRRSLAVVVPSMWQEPLGIVALEAMACGRAVIAARVGGLAEVVAGIGMLFPPGDSAALADCLEQIATRSSLRESCERAGREASRKYRVAEIGNRYLEIYREAIDSKAAPARTASRRNGWNGAASRCEGSSGTCDREAASRSKILLAHPGGQHSERLALALDRAGLLKRFVTGVRWNPHGPLGRALDKLPGRYAKHLARRFARRSFPGLSPGRVAARPLSEGAYLLATRWPVLRRQGERLVGWRNFIFDRSVARSLEREQPAGVICFDTCAIEAFRAARRLGIRTILDDSIAPLAAVRECYLREAEQWPEFADSLPRGLSPAYFAREAQELLLADCVLAPSAFVRQAVEDLGVPSDRIADVPFGVDLEKFTPRPRKPDNTFRILFVGKLTQRKGLAQLLEAFRRLRLPNARLELVGDLVGSGRWLPRYRHLFDWCPSATQGELAERYRQADVFVLPSLHEGSALVTYEALASGLPLITTPQTGSVARDGVEGFLVPAGEIEPLAEKMLELFRDPERRWEMGTRARRRAEEFSWEAYSERVAAAVRRTLGYENVRDFAAAHGLSQGERREIGGAIAAHS